MKPWTIDQLIFAREVCFPGDFLRLWSQHGVDPHLAPYFLAEMQRHGNLMSWMLHFSRDDLERNEGALGECFDEILTELIGDYGTPETGD